jgi:hypothetical protein
MFMAVPPELTLSVPPLRTTAPTAVPPEDTISLPPLRTTVPLATPPV